MSKNDASCLQTVITDLDVSLDQFAERLGMTGPNRADYVRRWLGKKGAETRPVPDWVWQKIESMGNARYVIQWVPLIEVDRVYRRNQGEIDNNGASVFDFCPVESLYRYAEADTLTQAWSEAQRLIPEDNYEEVRVVEQAASRIEGEVYWEETRVAIVDADSRHFEWQDV